MGKHLEESLQRDIDLIRSKVREMSGLCEKALQDVLQAFVEGSRQLAYLVVLRDRIIDELEKQIDRLCLEFLVRQQPVAGHLRFAYAAIKINADLERIGDYAENVARQVLKLDPLQLHISYEPFQQLAQRSIDMLHQTVEAFLDRDAELARRTMDIEREVDELRRRLDADLLRQQREDRIPLEALTPLMTISRRFERVSDKAKEMCAETLYMCTGEYAKHQGAEVFRILFVDRHNSCRSIMAEAIGNSLEEPKLRFSSAGLDPRSIDPRTLKFLESKGHETSNLRSKSLDQIPNLDHYQVIVALAEVARQVFPPQPTKIVCLDWQIHDPSRVEGSEEQIQRSYEEAYEFIRNHVQDLAHAILTQ